jgi:hypothetical protein
MSDYRKYASGDAWDAGLVEVFWSDDDEGYIAVVPDLPGCSGFGKTPEAPRSTSSATPSTPGSRPVAPAVTRSPNHDQGPPRGLMVGK